MTSSNFYERILERVGALAAGFPASENHMGEVGGNLALVNSRLTRPSGSGNYVAGSSVANATGGLASAIAFEDVARINGGKGYLNSPICHTNNATMAGQIRLFLFTASPLNIADDVAAATLKGTNNALFVGWVDYTSFITSSAAGATVARAAGSVLSGASASLAFRTEPGERRLYGVVQSLNSWTGQTGQTFDFQFMSDRY